MVKIKLNYILSAIVVVLLLLCAASVYGPVHFSNEKAKRETAVKERLVAIRKAEEAYRKMNGNYADSFGKLVECKLLDDSMRYVPYAENVEFELSASISRGQSGKMTPTMECGATYNMYLNGLDNNRIKELTESANANGLYPGLKFGDTTTPNDNAANWE